LSVFIASKFEEVLREECGRRIMAAEDEEEEEG